MAEAAAAAGATLTICCDRRGRECNIITTAIRAVSNNNGEAKVKFKATAAGRDL